MTFPRYLVVGGAGFIGSHLVERLVERGHVTVLDDLSTGRVQNLKAAMTSGRCELRIGSVFDADLLASSVAGRTVVFHLSANPEARRGIHNTALDVEQGTLATHAVLNASRRAAVEDLVLASSGTVTATPASYAARRIWGRCQSRCMARASWPARRS